MSSVFSNRVMQSFLFADNLKKQIDALESKSACNKARIEKKANSYMEMGFSAGEIKELISIDKKSIDKKSVDLFVDVVAGVDESKMYKWDFTIQDGRGKKWSSSTYGLSPVVAETREDAMEIASRSLRKILMANDAEVVVDVEKIDIQ